jgi:hypothetical protein
MDLEEVPFQSKTPHHFLSYLQLRSMGLNLHRPYHLRKVTLKMKNWKRILTKFLAKVSPKRTRSLWQSKDVRRALLLIIPNIRERIA